MELIAYRAKVHSVYHWWNPRRLWLTLEEVREIRAKHGATYPGWWAVF